MDQPADNYFLISLDDIPLGSGNSFTFLGQGNVLICVCVCVQPATVILGLNFIELQKKYLPKQFTMCVFLIPDC